MESLVYYSPRHLKDRKLFFKMYGGSVAFFASILFICYRYSGEKRGVKLNYYSLNHQEYNTLTLVYGMKLYSTILVLLASQNDFNIAFTGNFERCGKGLTFCFRVIMLLFMFTVLMKDLVII